MTKAEIIEAIEATIRPNGEKAITAESLANLLIEMVNATPEGGSGGGGVEYIATEFVDPDSMELTEEAMAHNAELFAKLADIMANGGCMPSVSMNMEGLILYATSLMPTEDGTIAALFNGPTLQELNNYMVEGTSTTNGTNSHLIVGTHLLLLIIYINPDGSFIVSLPGLES